MEESNQSPNQSPQLFSDTSAGMMAAADAAAVARATQEIQAALVIAQRFPRDEIKAKSRILQACQRKDLAELSEYEYSRGGTRITGPTIDLLRAIANRWGNIRFGWTEVDRRDGASFVRCFAWDLQSNGQAERTFTVKHWRDTQGGGYALEDERDIYELLANMAARRVRACLEEVIDSDIVTAAIDQCRLTLRSGEKVPLKDRVVQMLNAFTEFGVTKEMIEKRLGNVLDAVSENQLASLRRIFKSLKDGVGKREDFFKASEVPPNFAAGSAAQSASGAAVEPTRASPVAETFTRPPDAEAELIAAGLAPEPAPKAAAAAVEPATPPSNLKVLRIACKGAKIKESALMEHLNAIGVCDEVGSLEELQMTNAAAVEAVIKDWPAISARIKAAGKAEGK